MSTVDRIEDDLASILGLDVAELTMRRPLVSRFWDRTPGKIVLAALVATSAVVTFVAFVMVRPWSQLEQPRQVQSAQPPAYAMTVTAPEAPKAVEAPPQLRGGQSPPASPRRAPVRRAQVRQARATTRPEEASGTGPIGGEAPVPALALNELRPSPAQPPEAPLALERQPALEPTTEPPVGVNVRLARRERLEAIDEVRLLRQK